MAEKKQKLTKRQTIVQVAKFVAFSMGAGIIQIVSYTLIHELTGWAHWKCYLPSLVLSVLYNFTVNRRYTFKSATNVPVAMLKVAFYYCIFTPVSTYLGNLAETAGINNYIVEAVTMVCNLVTEFLVCRFWVYRNSINTNKLAEKEKTESKANIE
ncbi:MAG: GtrA family protein [Candidatus Fimenecus sp.]